MIVPSNFSEKNSSFLKNDHFRISLNDPFFVHRSNFSERHPSSQKNVVRSKKNDAVSTAVPYSALKNAS